MSVRAWAVATVAGGLVLCATVPEAQAAGLDVGRLVLTAAGDHLPGPSSKRLTIPRAGGPAACSTLPAGIRAQESGDRYGVRGVAVASHGGARALGAYQVMPANLPGWSLEVVGRRVSEQEFMASPALQDRIAGAKIRQACARWGVRGAAAWWFSGRPELANDPTPRGGGAASVKAYVDNVVALSGRAA